MATRMRRMRPAPVTLVLLLAVHLLGDAAAADQPAVSIVLFGKAGPAVKHGLEKVTEALATRGVTPRRVISSAKASADLLLLVALKSNTDAKPVLLKTACEAVPDGPEAIAIRRGRVGDKRAVAVAGSDDRGLMYGLLDVADRIRWTQEGDDPLSHVRATVDAPFVADRAISIYTMHQACFEQRFFEEGSLNEDYWARYFDMLARNRFNRFVLIFGYENWGYFSPPYPYFFDVKEFPGVRVVGNTPEKQRQYLAALNRMIDMAHARGLEFTVAIWDHIYRGGVQGPRDRAQKPTTGIVWGLEQDNLYPYTKVALAEFLRRVPKLDSIQFRMHGESGLRRNEMEAFWTDVYRVMLEHGREMRFDARAKNFPHDLIDKAVDMGVPIRICTKYWMEQMGLPFHPTHIHPSNQHDRRHGYADLLRYPKRYDVHWRLWNAGTTRVLLWGDPDYVRRFAESTHLYGAGGFEINEPMGTKMQEQPHDLPPFELLRPKYRYYDWEFERYWHFYQVFGRASYNPKTPAEVWRREFEQRFGKEAGPLVERALHRAGRILPRTVAYSYPYHHFPTTRGWVEMQRQDDLPGYAKALPSDTEQFLSMDAAAVCMLQGKDSAKIWPQQSSRWFARVADDVLSLAEEAEQKIGGRPSKEFISTMVDLKILAHLARYHSWRARAGVAYALFSRSQDAAALEEAIAYEARAVDAWKAIVNAAGDVYHDDLMMGRRASGLAGHWRDELTRLEAGLADLRRKRKQFQPEVTDAGPALSHVPIRRTKPAKDLIVRATVASGSKIREVRLQYQSGAADSKFVTMKNNSADVYRGIIPGESVTPGLTYFIEAVDDQGRNTTWPPATNAGPLAVTVTDDHTSPSVKHTPIATAEASKPLRITAIVNDPTGVKWVRLRYRSVTQFEDYRTLEMSLSGNGNRYTATVPAEHVPPRWDFMYFIEVMDRHGNGAIYPDLEKKTPYIIVKLQR